MGDLDKLDTGMKPPEDFPEYYSLERLDRLASMLDTRFKVPGTDWRFGMDAVIGLIPGVGDLAGAGISGYIFWKARKMGVSRWGQGKIAAIIAVDAVIGTIPVFGDVFDAAWKGNKRSVNVLRKELIRRSKGRGVRQPDQ